MEELGFDNLLTDIDVNNLFGGMEEGADANDDVIQQGDKNNVEEAKTVTEESNKQKNNITDVNPDELFGGLQESVGDGEEENQEGENNSEKGGNNSSPNFHSSVLNALKEDGILPELSDEDITNVKDDEGFKDAIEKVIQDRLDERTKRIENALNAGADIGEIKQYENILTTLNNIDEDALKQEGAKGDDLRRRIIAQDLMNRGYSEDKIKREVKKSFDAGTDIEDAIEALQANVQFYTQKYSDLIEEGKEQAKKYKEDMRRQGEELRKSIVEDKGIFDEIGMDKRMRQKVYDNISKPSYKTKDGNWLTELQKYQMENQADFLKYVSLFYTMTDGFKDLSPLIKKQVKKERTSSIKELENKLKGTNRVNTGRLNYVNSNSEENDDLKFLFGD